MRDVNLARILLDRRAHLEVRNVGLTPLFSAILTGDEDLVQLLLERGADANEKAQCSSGRGEFVLHMAVSAGHDKLLPLLIKRGVYVDTQGEKPPERTALHVAVWLRNEVALQTLLDWGVDVSGTDGRRCTLPRQMAD